MPKQNFEIFIYKKNYEVKTHISALNMSENLRSKTRTHFCTLPWSPPSLERLKYMFFILNTFTRKFKEIDVDYEELYGDITICVFNTWNTKNRNALLYVSLLNLFNITLFDFIVVSILNTSERNNILIFNNHTKTLHLCVYWIAWNTNNRNIPKLVAEFTIIVSIKCIPHSDKYAMFSHMLKNRI